MFEKELIERYAYYYDDIQKLKKASEDVNPLLMIKSVQVKDLSRGTIQKGYKEIKELNFPGSLIWYLIMITMAFNFYLASKIEGKKPENIVRTFKKILYQSDDLYCYLWFLSGLSMVYINWAFAFGTNIEIKTNELMMHLENIGMGTKNLPQLLEQYYKIKKLGTG